MLTKLKVLLTAENKEKIRSLIYSIGGVAVFNMVLQFFVYPSFERELGEVQYGVILSILSFLAITAGTCGSAVNYARIMGLEKEHTESADYNLLILLLCTLSNIAGVIYLVTLKITDPLSIGLYLLLTIVTLLRYYSDVEFRIHTNFLRYMIFYLIISAGYLLGVLVFRLSGVWMLALILGEVASIFYVACCGKIYRPPFFKKTAAFGAVFTSVGMLTISFFFENITLHADRILLLALTGDGAAVTTYYIASLVGKLVALLIVPINSMIISYLVQYKGKLTTKMWSVIATSALGFSLIAFLGCWLVSPLLVYILYPDSLATVRVFFVPAILGQILYFVSGALLTVLLRFYGERLQLFFNIAYVVEFFILVILGTHFFDLWGFVLAILLANAIRFIVILIFGFCSNGKAKIENADVDMEVAEA